MIVLDLDADGQVETCTEYYDRLIMPNGARTPYADDPRRSAIGLAVGVRQHVMASELREQRRLPLGIELDGAVSIGCRPDQAQFSWSRSLESLRNILTAAAGSAHHSEGLRNSLIYRANTLLVQEISLFIFRREATYYWRRRTPCALANFMGRQHVFMSLRTTCPVTARRLATQLDAILEDAAMLAENTDLHLRVRRTKAEGTQS